ncbi:MAG: collagen-like protein, partial [Dehalococcoidia bacterium]|nr:collagen-like protein [Dehalococcoidia bacterium]
MCEERLKRYFDLESHRGDLSPHQWDELLLYVKSHKQRRRFWRLLPPLIARRPLLSAVSSFVLVVMVVGISLWMAAPWEGNSPGVPAAPGGWGLVSIPGEPGLPGISGNPGAPGRPAPIIVEKAWEVDKSTIKPGEPVTVTLTLTNVWDDRIEITEFPSMATLNQINVDGEEQIEVELKRTGGASTTLEPGEEFIAIADITSDMSAVLPPDIYGIRLDVSIERGPERRTSRLGFSMGSFVVIPPEGALDTTVIVDRAREANGVRVT